MSASLSPDIRAAALNYLAAGFSPLPLPYRTKRPAITGWPSVTIDEAFVCANFNGASQNIGLRLGEQGLADVDLDCSEAIRIADLFLPDTGMISGRRSKPSSHWWYRSDPPQKTRQFRDPLALEDEAMILELRCLKSDGGIGEQTVAPPSVHESGEPIAFDSGCTRIPANVDGEPLLRSVSRLAATALLGRHFPPDGSRNTAFLALAGWLARAGWSREEILPVHRGIYRVLWGAASRDSQCIAEVDQTLRRIELDQQTTGYPKLKDLLGDNGGKILRTVATWCEIERGINRSLLSFYFNDLGNAQRVQALHGDDLLFCVAEDAWYEYDGTRWRRDRLLATQKRAKLTMVEFLNQAIKVSNDDAARFARASMDQGKISAALSSLRCEAPVEVSFFDRQTHLLNFRNGTVDLRKGERRDHSRPDYLTRLIHHNYNPSAQCPHFLLFLRQCMGVPLDAGEDAEYPRADVMVSYLQVVFGYCLTAETKEKALFVAWGAEGNNGKTTLLSLIRELLREYSTTVSLDLLTSKEENNNTLEARADLIGQRVVITSEVEEGQRVTAAKLKRITQGEGGEIEACRKYESRITFPESHKLWLDANSKPELSATDTAVWNRIHLVEFPLSVPEGQQNKKLREELLATEAEGILSWMVAGAKRYYAEGLQKPADVVDATKKWREENDRLKEFTEETIERVPASEGAFVWNKILFARYLSWCEERKCKPLSHIGFSSQMLKLGFSKGDNGNQGVRWVDVRFRGTT